MKNIDTVTCGKPVGIDEVPPQLLIPSDQKSDPGIPHIEMSIGMIKSYIQFDQKDAADTDSYLFCARRYNSFLLL